MHTLLILGCGSLGATTAVNLSRRHGDTLRFILVDHDKIEHVNLANQPWMDLLIGQKKVTALASLLYRIAKVKAIPVNRRVKDSSFHLELEHILQKHNWDGVDLVIDCFDNIPSRNIAHRLALHLEAPILHAGFSENSFHCTWKNIFRGVKPSNREPVCDRREMSSIVQLGAAISEHVATEWLMNKRQLEYFLTKTDTLSLQLLCK